MLTYKKVWVTYVSGKLFSVNLQKKSFDKANTGQDTKKR